MNPELNQPLPNKRIDDEIGFDKVVPFELIYEDVCVYATIKAEF